MQIQQTVITNEGFKYLATYVAKSPVDGVWILVCDENHDHIELDDEEMEQFLTKHRYN